MRVVRTEKFKTMLEKLPLSVQTAYAEQERVLQADPRDPRLHIKKLRGMDDTTRFASRAHIVHFLYGKTILSGCSPWVTGKTSTARLDSRSKVALIFYTGST